MNFLPEASRATSHNFALANQFGIEFASIESEVDVEVDTVESTLWGIHALKILLKVLATEIGCKCDDFLDACVRFGLAVALEKS